MKPYYEHGGITIYHGDCREILPCLPIAFCRRCREPLADSEILAIHLAAQRDVGPLCDLLATDPPYGQQADKAGAHSSIRDNPAWPVGGWDAERPSAGTFGLLLNQSQDAAIWGGNYFADLLPPSTCWLVWVKPESETGFSLADCELCWTSKLAASRVRTSPRRNGNLHPTQKTLRVMTWTLQFMGGNSVVDPFCGSGTTLVAAKSLGRRAIGIEIEEKYCEIAAKRLSQEVFSFDGANP